MLSLEDIGVSVGSERSSISLDVLGRYEELLGHYQDMRPSIIDLTAEVESSRELWRRRFPGATINVVYSFTDGRTHADAARDIHTSSTFGEEFWVSFAENCRSDFVLSDGRVSVYHQMQMFKILFPALNPGGTYILEECLSSIRERQESNGLKTPLVFDFFSTLSRAIAGHSRETDKLDEFQAYCLRNVESIEFFRGNIVVRKREFVQLTLRARPFIELASDFRVLDSPHPYDRVSAAIFGSDVISERMRKIIETASSVTPPRAEIGCLENVKVVGAGIVTVDDLFIVKESFINQNHVSRRAPFFRIGSSDLYVSEDSLDSFRSLDDDCQYVIGKQTWDANFGHWLVDTLPRMLNLTNIVRMETARIVLNGNRSEAMRSVFVDSLQLLGVCVEQLEWTDHRPVHFRRVMYATPMSVPPMTKSELSIRNLESLIPLIPNDVMERYGSINKIYLSRNRYSRRRLTNEEDILPLLVSRGYTVIYPEELTLYEQIALFSGASHVVGNMGAAFSSLAFSPKGVKVFMLATELMMHDYFYDLVCHKSGTYIGLQGKSFDRAKDIGSDFEVDAILFARLLNEFE